MKTLFIRSSFILMSTASIFANEESFEQRVGYVKTHLAMLYAAKKPISLSATTDADKICLNINNSNVDNCFSKEEFSSFLIEKYKETAAKRDKDICDQIRQLNDHNLPVGKATLSVNLHSEAPSIDFSLDTAEKNLLSFNAKEEKANDITHNTVKLSINEMIEISQRAYFDRSDVANVGVLEKIKIDAKDLRNDNNISADLKANRNNVSIDIKAFIANAFKGSYYFNYDNQKQELNDLFVNIQNPKYK